MLFHRLEKMSAASRTPISVSIHSKVAPTSTGEARWSSSAAIPIISKELLSLLCTTAAVGDFDFFRAMWAVSSPNGYVYNQLLKTPPAEQRETLRVWEEICDPIYRQNYGYSLVYGLGGVEIPANHLAQMKAGYPHLSDRDVKMVSLIANLVEVNSLKLIYVMAKQTVGIDKDTPVTMWLGQQLEMRGVAFKVRSLS